MNKNNYEIYMIAMINLLINDNNKTDFGNYILEYDYGFSTVRLGGKIPKEVIPFIDAAFNCSIDNIKNSSNGRKI